MSHDGGPLEFCHNCQQHFRDSHECLGLPETTVHKFVRRYGAEKVRGWVKLAETGVQKEVEDSLAEELERKRKGLLQKIEEGKEAASELKKLARTVSR